MANAADNPERFASGGGATGRRVDGPARASRPGASGPAPGVGPRRLALAAGLIVVTLVVFTPTLRNGFVAWDDVQALVANPHLRGLGLTEIGWMFSTRFWGHYQPLFWLSFALDHAVSGFQPGAVHLTSNILHAANTVLVFLLAMRLLHHGRASPSFRLTELPAALAALCYAVHPLRVEPVAWATGRGDLLVTLFLLLASLAWWRAVTRRAPLPGSAGRAGGSAPFDHTVSAPWLALALLAYLGALFSRASAVMLAPALLILDWYPLRRLGRSPVGWWGPAARRVYLEKLAFLVPAVPFAFLTAWAKAESGATASWELHGLLPRVAVACYGVVFYLWKTIWPVALSPVYELHAPVQILEARYVVPAVLTTGFVAVVYYARRRTPALTAAFLAYLLFLAPVAGFFQAGFQIAADRYSYLPLIPLTLLFAGFLARAFLPAPVGVPAGRRRTQQANASAARSLPAAGTWLVVVPLALAGVWSVLSWRQAAVWRDTESLWRHALRVSPASSVAHDGMGYVLAKQGRHAEAAEQFRKAVQIQPLHQAAWRNLCVELRKLGRSEAVIATLRDAIRLCPFLVDAHYELGLELEGAGDVRGAIASYREMLRRVPGHAGARQNLFRLLADTADDTRRGGS